MRAVELSLQSAPSPLRQTARLPRAARANQTRIAFSPRAASQTEQQAERRSNTTVSSTQYRVLVTGSTKGAALPPARDVRSRVSWNPCGGFGVRRGGQALNCASHRDSSRPQERQRCVDRRWVGPTAATSYIKCGGGRLGGVNCEPIGHRAPNDLFRRGTSLAAKHTRARRPWCLKPEKVIPGARAGIGRALVDQFLSQGDSVCVTSRTSDAVNAVVTFNPPMHM